MIIAFLRRHSHVLGPLGGNEWIVHCALNLRQEILKVNFQSIKAQSNHRSWTASLGGPALPRISKLFPCRKLHKHLKVSFCPQNSTCLPRLWSFELEIWPVTISIKTLVAALFPVFAYSWSCDSLGLWGLWGQELPLRAVSMEKRICLCLFYLNGRVALELTQGSLPEPLLHLK